MAVPYKNKPDNKKKQIAEMFNNVSGKYDFLNHLLSLGIDKWWRKKAIKLFKQREGTCHLDIATGTGDFAFEAFKLKPKSIVGVDISAGMLSKAKEKFRKKKTNIKVSFEEGDGEHLNFPNDTFNTMTVGFGVRNFENLELGLREMHRVLAPKGQLMILEFSKPRKSPFKQLYHFYFWKVVPFIGRIVSKDDSAYHYLPESVMEFPDGQDFLSILDYTGYKNLKQHSLFFGIATIYEASK